MWPSDRAPPQPRRSAGRPRLSSSRSQPVSQGGAPNVQGGSGGGAPTLRRHSGRALMAAATSSMQALVRLDLQARSSRRCTQGRLLRAAAAKHHLDVVVEGCSWHFGVIALARHSVTVKEELLEVPANVVGAHRRPTDCPILKGGWQRAHALKPRPQGVLIPAVDVCLAHQRKGGPEVSTWADMSQAVQNLLLVAGFLVVEHRGGKAKDHKPAWPIFGHKAIEHRIVPPCELSEGCHIHDQRGLRAAEEARQGPRAAGEVGDLEAVQGTVLRHVAAGDVCSVRGAEQQL
mmetsp:Transcript_4451/g.9004  ORF Transcript_4451/g.9004 Transcript_4451/m.9004 type:complete len:289 (-) Transcript_4451:90-956(-)